MNGSTVCKIATQHFPHKFNHQSNVRLRNNIRLSTATIVTFCREVSFSFSIRVKMKRASVSLLLCTDFVLPAQDVSIGRQRHVGSRHTCPSYAYMCRDDGGGIDAFIRNKCKKTVVYTRVNGALHIENCKNYKKVITHQHIA